MDNNLNNPISEKSGSLFNNKTAVGSKLFKNQNMQFLASYFDLENLNSDKKIGKHVESIVEVAFFGRSNAGKSSLINALAFNQKLAYTSKMPGCTKSINFYSFQKNANFFLVDLPGYGYAKVDNREIRVLSKMLEKYFVSRIQLKKVYILIDSRVGLQKNDIEFLNFFNNNGIWYSIVLTKVDKMNKSQLDEMADLLKKSLSIHQYFSQIILAVSSKRAIGLDNLRADIFLTLSKAYAEKETESSMGY